MFIGHSEPVSQLCVSQDDTRLVSCGDAIFVWNLSLHTPPLSPTPASHPPTIPKSSSPRRRAPSPMSFEHLKAHSFTPLTHYETKERKEDTTCVKNQASEGESVKVTICNDEHHSESSESSAHSTTPTAQKHYRYVVVVLSRIACVCAYTIDIIMQGYVFFTS